MDLTGRIDEAEKILKMLRSVSLFERVELIKPIKDGFITDGYSFPFVFMGERAVVLRRLAYEILLKKMRKKYGTGFEAMLYFVGFKLGYYAYENHRELLGDEIDMLLKAKCELFKGLGYGV